MKIVTMSEFLKALEGYVIEEHWFRWIWRGLTGFIANLIWLAGAILGGAALIVAGITAAAGVVAILALVVPVLAVVWLLWEIAKRIRSV